MTAEPGDRFFYHSFPRPRANEDASAKGLKILKSMGRNGLLLVPERVSWHDPTGAKPGDKVHAMQRRICFTELSPSEVAEHAKVFGPWALEFPISEIRAWGALPVIYVPDAVNSTPTLEWTGVSLLARIAGAQQILANLVGTQQLTAPTIEMDLKMRDGSVYFRQFNEPETQAIRDYLRFIEGAPGLAIQEVSNALHSLSSMFYPTENPRYTGPLGYYRQREWRLISGAFFCGHSITTVTNADQRNELIDIDSKFFGEKLQYPDGEFTCAAKSHYFSIISEKHPLSALHRLIAPAVAVDQARSILTECHIKAPVVALEELK